MELIKSQIQLSLTKGELNQLLAEALADPESSAAIKKVLNPLSEGNFRVFIRQYHSVQDGYFRDIPLLIYFLTFSQKAVKR